MALRFIENVTLRDKIKSSSLHERTKIKAFNVRLHRLSTKSLNTIINNYSPNSDLNPGLVYKFSDYEITTDPIRTRKRPILQRINKYLSAKRKCKLFKLNKEWPEPLPIYS